MHSISDCTDPRRVPVSRWAQGPEKTAGTGNKGRVVRYSRRMAEPSEQNVALGPVDFSTHILSLASTALIALGKMPAPDGVQQALDLETARHLIDVLGMLEQKTKGNLDEAETKLLQSLIYDLRVAYVDAQKPQ